MKQGMPETWQAQWIDPEMTHDAEKRQPASCLRRRFTAEKTAEERRKEIYKKIPRIKEIDEEIRQVGSELSRALILNSSDESARELSEKMEQLAEDRAIILTENNYDMNYTEVRYKCDKCNDTGLTDMGERCSCIKDRMIEAEEWEEKRKRG